MSLVTNEPVNPPDGTIVTADLADDSVTNGKLRESAALSVIGRSANSTGNPADIAAAAASGAVLREAGSVLGFGQVATAGIADGAVTAAKLSATYRLVDDDVISRQTLGADAQDITIAVDGDADERVEIEGFGESNATGTCSIKFGSTTLDLTKIISANGANPTGSAANGVGASIADEAMGFRMIFDLRRQGTCDRGGLVQWWIGYGASSEEAYWSGVVYHDTSTNITSIVLAGSVANFFASGFKVICRRRRMSA